ncbi:unnamed protein product, partial [Trichogramma brassicae]
RQAGNDEPVHGRRAGLADPDRPHERHQFGGLCRRQYPRHWLRMLSAARGRDTVHLLHARLQLAADELHPGRTAAVLLQRDHRVVPVAQPVHQHVRPGGRRARPRRLLRLLAGPGGHEQRALLQALPAADLRQRQSRQALGGEGDAGQDRGPADERLDRALSRPSRSTAAPSPASASAATACTPRAAASTRPASCGRSVVSVLTGHSRYVACCAFSRNGNMLATGSNDKKVIVWDLTGNLSLDSEVLRHNGGVKLHNSEKSLIQETDVVKHAETSGNDVKLIQKLDEHNGAVNSVCMFGNRLVASASSDKLVRVWSVKYDEEGESMDVFQEMSYNPLDGHTFSVNFVEFSPCGTKLASCSMDGNTIIWDIETGTQVRTSFVNSGTAVRVCRWSPDGSKIATAGDDEKTIVWDLETMDETRLAYIRELASINCRKICQKQTMLVYALPRKNYFNRRYEIQFDRTARAQTSNGSSFAEQFRSSLKLPLSEPFSVLEGHAEAITAIAFTPDSRYIATACNEGTWRLYDARAQESGPALLCCDSSHDLGVQSCDFSPTTGPFTMTGKSRSSRIEIVLYDCVVRRLEGRELGRGQGVLSAGQLRQRLAHPPLEDHRHRRGAGSAAAGQLGRWQRQQWQLDRAPDLQGEAPIRRPRRQRHVRQILTGARRDPRQRRDRQDGSTLERSHWDLSTCSRKPRKSRDHLCLFRRHLLLFDGLADLVFSRANPKTLIPERNGFLHRRPIGRATRITRRRINNQFLSVSISYDPYTDWSASSNAPRWDKPHFVTRCIRGASSSGSPQKQGALLYLCPRRNEQQVRRRGLRRRIQGHAALLYNAGCGASVVVLMRPMPHCLFLQSTQRAAAWGTSRVSSL